MAIESHNLEKLNMYGLRLTLLLFRRGTSLIVAGCLNESIRRSAEQANEAPTDYLVQKQKCSKKTNTRKVKSKHFGEKY